MSVQAHPEASAAASDRARLTEGPVVVEARGVEKTFRIPQHRVDSFKERASHPLRGIDYRELHVLRDISFDVHQGEFFGIVGRNGSGKSSLLKIMASIYRADAGRIRMAGRVAPFIELGVGFNPELTARENVVLNGVMMGLSRQDARRRLGAVLEFAELEDFVEMRLKNYSSGMMVRLAFAVMVQADADVMLIDEVLAVGDAAFAQKCMDVFQEKRRAGKTIVLVTHDMAAVQGLCDRAMLIHDGELGYLGDPEETAMRYYRMNFGGDSGDDEPEAAGGIPDIHARPVRSWLENELGEHTDNVEQGRPIGLNLVVEARRELVEPTFRIEILNVEGAVVFGVDTALGVEDGANDRLDAGQRIRVRAKIDNPLLPGRYVVHLWIFRQHKQRGALQLLRPLDFVVYGTRPGTGMVSVQADVEIVPEPPAGPGE